MAKSRKGACGRSTKRSRKGGKGKGKGACGKDIKFGSSMKARQFIGAKMGRQTVEAVGGINGVLGSRLKTAGVGTAKKLTCKMREMTKRNYLRYMMEVLYYAPTG